MNNMNKHEQKIEGLNEQPIHYHQCGYCKHYRTETLHSKVLDEDVFIGYCDNEHCRYYHTERSCIDAGCDQLDDKESDFNKLLAYCEEVKKALEAD